jgi:hypothetical protein
VNHCTRWFLGICTLLAFSPSAAASQALYAGVGLGPTVVLDGVSGGKNVYRQFYGVVGFQPARPFGIRLEGSEAFGFVWLSADLTYRPGGGSLRPYAFAGPGLRIDQSDAEPLATAGAGLQLGLGRTVSLFAECRLQHILADSPQKTFLPLTVGVSVWSRPRTPPNKRLKLAARVD